MSSEPPSAVIVALETEPEYVLGFPVYVALTLAASPPGASLTQVPAPQTHQLYGAIGVRLWRAGDSDPFVDVPANGMVDSDLGLPGMSLRAGRQRRLLLEISSLLPEDLAAGEYTAELRYGTRARFATSPRFALRLREPTRAEREQAAALQPELSAAGSWAEWAEQRGPNASALRPPTSASDPLRYPRALKYLLHGPVPLGAIDEGFLALLDGLFAPDAEGLRAELLAAKDRAAFAAHAARVKATWPGLTTWMNEIEDGTSAIAWTRTQG